MAVFSSLNVISTTTTVGGTDLPAVFIGFRNALSLVEGGCGRNRGTVFMHRETRGSEPEEYHPPVTLIRAAGCFSDRANRCVDHELRLEPAGQGGWSAAFGDGRQLRKGSATRGAAAGLASGC